MWRDENGDYAILSICHAVVGRARRCRTKVIVISAHSRHRPPPRRAEIFSPPLDFFSSLSYFHNQRNDETMISTKHTAALFKALSDPNRIRILKMLEIRPLCVCEITAILPISTSTASKHLQILRDAGFITDTKDGKYVEYAITDASKESVVSQVLSYLRCCCGDDEEVRAYPKRLKQIDRYSVCGL
jgi:ArsR family transcriptional regulator, arsenate/arsenite/antimonite-responsive transcriptional repressor